MPTSNLGPDWQRLDDGTAYRRAARIVVLDDDDRVLLARGHDLDQPERSWYFTIGGGLAPGESERAGAVRELAEETGIALGEADLIGPVLTREAEFEFYAETVRQDEVFFLAYTPAYALSTAGWTEVEQGILDEVAWIRIGELESSDVEIFPEQLPELVRQWRTGWDGCLTHLGRQEEGRTA